MQGQHKAALLVEVWSDVAGGVVDGRDIVLVIDVYTQRTRQETSGKIYGARTHSHTHTYIYTNMCTHKLKVSVNKRTTERERENM